MSNSLRRLVGAVVVRGYGRTGRKGLARGGRVRTEGLRPPVCCRAVCGACVSLCLPARSWCRSVGSGFRGRGVPAASNGCGLLCRGFWTRARSVGGRVAGRGYGRPQAADILVWGTRVVCCGSCGCAAFSGNDDCHKVHRPMFRGRSRHALGVTACVGAAEGSHPVVWAVSAGGRTNTQTGCPTVSYASPPTKGCRAGQPKSGLVGFAGFPGLLGFRLGFRGDLPVRGERDAPREPV